VIRFFSLCVTIYYDVFNDDVSWSDSVTSNGKKISEIWSGEYRYYWSKSRHACLIIFYITKKYSGNV